ncbi:MAG TPA: ABC transporter permease [Bryobacteraceae bacterium]|nr:ABC transporter permease [Bryobacteraceae bacterium]
MCVLTALGRFEQDLRYGFRMLRRSPGFMATAVLSLALAIGANTAVFSVLDELLLRSLPVRDPHQLALLTLTVSNKRVEVGPGVVWNLRQTLGNERNRFMYGLYRGLRDSNRVFSELLAALGPTTVEMTTRAGSNPGSSEQVHVDVVTGNYFSTLGVAPILGRVFTASDDQVLGSGGSQGPVVVLGYRFWQRRFARDPAVLGRSIQLNRVPFTIVGVARSGFDGESVGSPADLWAPITMLTALSPGNRLEMTEFTLIGRLKAGISHQQAQQAMQALLPHVPGWPRGWQPSWFGVLVKDGSKGVSSLRAKLSMVLIVLTIAAGMVLLIACANLSTLLLTRAAARRKEVAVRLSVGAGRARLIGQLLTESLMLAVIGGVTGWFLAQWGAAVLVALISGDSPNVLAGVHPDVRILGFATALTLFAAILFGLAPALQATRLDLITAMKGSSPASCGNARGNNIGRLLIGVQVALSVVLLVGALLFLRTLRNLETLDIGYSREHTLLITFDLGNAGYRGVTLAGLTRELERRIRALPGVLSTSVATCAPFDNSPPDNTPITVPGYGRDDQLKTFNDIGPDFFRTTGIPLLRGREIGPQDVGPTPVSSGGGNGPLTPTVAVVNEAFVRKYLRGRGPVGERFLLGARRTSVEIVGVVKDANYGSLREPVAPTIYLPVAGNLHWSSLNLFVHFTGSSREVTPLISATRTQVGLASGSVRIASIQTLQNLVDRSLIQERIAADLASIAGTLALLLVSIGLYGIVAHTVARRTQEIGIRVALGARRRDIYRVVLREILAVVFAGIAVGVLAALAAARPISAKLFGINAADPLTITGAILLITTVAATACLIPARRAAKVDPIVALHYE